MLRFGLPGPTKNFKIVCYNDSSLENFKDGGSQGGFIIYLVGENDVSSPIMWKSKKLCRVVKSTMAAETLIQVKAIEACLWLANLWSKMLYCKHNDDKNIKIEFILITISYMILSTLLDLYKTNAYEQKLHY